jgi:hypothetical protein
VVYALLKSGIAYDRSMIEHAIERRREQAAHAARSQTAKPCQPHQFNCLLARAALKIAFSSSQSTKSGSEQ